MLSRKPHFVVNAPRLLQPDFDKISTQYHQLKSAYRAAATDKAMEQQREFGCGVTLWRWSWFTYRDKFTISIIHRECWKPRSLMRSKRKRSWVWAQAYNHHHPLIKAEYSSRNTVFGAKKLGLSLNSFAVATRRWPTCDHHHHPLISAERQSINARLRELGVKRLALSAPCSLPSQPDGSLVDNQGHATSTSRSVLHLHHKARLCSGQYSHLVY